MTSLEPCSSYLASRAEASKRALARSAPGRKQQRRRTGRHKRPVRGNRQGFQIGPPLRACLVDMTTTKSHFVRGKLLFAIFGILCHPYWSISCLSELPFFSFQFFSFLLGWVSSPTPGNTPFSKCIFVDRSYILSAAFLVGSVPIS